MVWNVLHMIGIFPIQTQDLRFLNFRRLTLKKGHCELVNQIAKFAVRLSTVANGRVLNLRRFLILREN